MTTQDVTPQARLAALERRWADLQDDLALKPVHDNLSAVQGTLSTLPVQLEQIRSRGYAFKAFLERKAQVLQDQWAPLRDQVTAQIPLQVSALSTDTSQITMQFSRLRSMVGAPAMAAPLAAQLDGMLTTLESKVRAAVSTLNSMFDELKSNADQTKRQIDEISRTLDLRDQASFRLLVNEDIVLAVPAQWDKDGKDDPKGNLFLTDGRVLFERREEVAKKKVLFIATEKEMVQELQLEVTVPDVEAVKPVSKGLMGKDDWLEFIFQGRAPVRAANFHIWYECKDWVALFGRVQSGEIAQERVKAKDAAAAAAVKAAPVKCPTCGATLNVQIVVGMTQINCDYCGGVIRL